MGLSFKARNMDFHPGGEALPWPKGMSWHGCVPGRGFLG